MKKLLALLLVPLRAVLHGMGVGLCVGLVLALWFSVARGLMLAYYWPTPGGELWAELPVALLMGFRFDLKMGAIATLLLFPLLGWRWCMSALVIRVWASLFALLAVINFYYYGFYKLPIDSVIFGLADDDTVAVLHTIWQDFPMLQIAVVLVLAVWSANAATLRVGQCALQWLQQHGARAWHVLFIPVLLVLVLMVGKGTLKGMALQLDNITATSKPFLNNVIPNGVTALYNAWDAYRTSTDIGEENTGLKALGFESYQDAARAYGLTATTPEGVDRALMASGRNQPNGKNLVFFQMESWSAEPFKYQSKDMDVLAGLNAKLHNAWVFDNFDSAHHGTHPALEAILFNTPVTPITNGKYRHITLDWGVPFAMKKAGYDTVFVTSGQSGWRELNRVLLIQSFDEVIDAATLRAKYPGAEGGIWGVWDSYMFRYIEERLAQQPKGRPLFIYAMSTTNHPPYELPSDYQPFAFDIRNWPGDKGSEQLIPNLQTYRYANDELAKFVTAVERSPAATRTVVAATGDHNVRTFGQYATPESQILRQQVPFIVWGAGKLSCPNALHQAASHLDMFPTLFPMLGIGEGYLNTGRDLTQCPNAANSAEAMAVTFIGQVRSNHAIWSMGNAHTLACQPVGSVCEWQATQDAKARARVALMDWHIRHHIHQATGKKP
jgi:phosphoglycerol transferase MdoB-like AlkP superfamily enzyme